MDFNKLTAFLCVAKHHNFTKASEELFISQPALSKKITDFEHEMDAKLFIRDNRNVILTPAGEALYQEAPLVLQLTDDLERRIHAIHSSPQQSLSIACSGMEYARFTPLIHDFQVAHPEISISLQWCNPTYSRNLLYTKMVDFAFMLDVEEHDEQIGSLPFFYDQLDIIMSNYHPLAERPYVTFEELKDENFIAINSGSNQLPYNHIINHFSANHIEFNGGVKMSDSLDSLVLQVSAGLGIAMLSRQVSLIYGKMVRFVPLKKDYMRVQTDLVWNKQKENPAKDTFVKYVKDQNENYEFSLSTPEE